eukprot:971220-Pyramimonas_sp.AAC.1
MPKGLSTDYRPRIKVFPDARLCVSQASLVLRTCSYWARLQHRSTVRLMTVRVPLLGSYGQGPGVRCKHLMAACLFRGWMNEQLPLALLSPKAVAGRLRSALAAVVKVEQVGAGRTEQGARVPSERSAAGGLSAECGRWRALPPLRRSAFHPPPATVRVWADCTRAGSTLVVS